MTAGNQSQAMLYKTIDPEMSEAVICHLRESFFADEPLNKAVQLVERGQPHAALEAMCLATIADGFSIAAVENNAIFTILYTMSRDLDLFEKFKVDRILECRIVSVSETARGRGLAKELVRRSIQRAQDCGFKMFKADATGAYSQRICSSLGMKVQRKVRYDEYCDATGAPVFQVPPPHDALCIMTLEIR